jgi:SOS response regulatory protein OraA/RecX
LSKIDGFGYLNDTEYVTRRAELMAKKGYGDIYIRHYLQRMEIPEELVDKALDSLDKNLAEEKRIFINIEKKPEKGREKMIRYLCNRGFDMETIFNAMDERQKP